MCDVLGSASVRKLELPATPQCLSCLQDWLPHSQSYKGKSTKKSLFILGHIFPVGEKHWSLKRLLALMSSIHLSSSRSPSPFSSMSLTFDKMVSLTPYRPLISVTRWCMGFSVCSIYYVPISLGLQAEQAITLKEMKYSNTVTYRLFSKRLK